MHIIFKSDITKYRKILPNNEHTCTSYLLKCIFSKLTVKKNFNLQISYKLVTSFTCINTVLCFVLFLKKGL